MVSSLLAELETAVREHERLTQAIAQLEDRLERKVQAQMMISRQSEFEIGEMRQMLDILRDDLEAAAIKVTEIKVALNE